MPRHNQHVSHFSHFWQLTAQAHLVSPICKLPKAQLTWPENIFHKHNRVSKPQTNQTCCTCKIMMCMQQSIHIYALTGTLDADKVASLSSPSQVFPDNKPYPMHHISLHVASQGQGSPWDCTYAGMPTHNQHVCHFLATHSPGSACITNLQASQATTHLAREHMPQAQQSIQTTNINMLQMQDHGVYATIHTHICTDWHFRCRQGCQLELPLTSLSRKCIHLCPTLPAQAQLVSPICKLPKPQLAWPENICHKHNKISKPQT